MTCTLNSDGIVPCHFVFSKVSLAGFSSPTIEDLLPPLSPAEYASLKASVARYGPRSLVVVDQYGDVVDGRHLDRACNELGKPCPREIRHFDSETEKLETALTINCNRRHLNRQRKRELIATYLRYDPGINDRHLAEIVAVSKNTVADVRAELESTGQIDHLPVRRCRDGKHRPAKYRIVANTANELNRALDVIQNLPESPADKIVDVTTAGRHARRHARKQEIAGKPVIPLPDNSFRLYHCRFQELEQVAAIALGSVNLICTDIPYVKEFLPELSDLAALAQRILVDGGLMVTYSGQYYLDRVMKAFGDHLTYRWTLASTWIGEGPPVYPLDLCTKWTPVLVFSKGPWRNCGRWYDVLRSESKEKDWHPWQKPVADVETLIRFFSEPGDLVVDPCGGGFTTAVACRNLSRRVIACDIDAHCVAAGWQRLAANSEDGAFQPSHDETSKNH